MIYIMGIREKNVSKKSRKSGISTVLYVVAAVVAVVGVALLVNNVLLFKNTVSQYVAEGYPAKTVLKELVPSMLPGIFEPIGVYGGITFLILGVGIVNKKISKCLVLLDKVEVSNDIIEENIVNADNTDNTEIKGSAETV
ncbi:MAG: hypothetical protein MUO60_15325 [Clostridiaceae bacterium]|nr:hypothetical protein [Clostridiaceae bacterium]